MRHLQFYDKNTHRILGSMNVRLKFVGLDVLEYNSQTDMTGTIKLPHFFDKCTIKEIVITDINLSFHLLIEPIHHIHQIELEIPSHLLGVICARDENELMDAMAALSMQNATATTAPVVHTYHTRTTWSSTAQSDFTDRMQGIEQTPSRDYFAPGP